LIRGITLIKSKLRVLKFVILSCLIALSIGLLPGTSVSADIGMGHAFYGTVQIDGNVATSGTVSANVSGGGGASSPVGSNGSYSLLLQGDIDEGTGITFYVNGQQAGSGAYHDGWTTQLNLSIITETTTTVITDIIVVTDVRTTVKTETKTKTKTVDVTITNTVGTGISSIVTITQTQPAIVTETSSATVTDTLQATETVTSISQGGTVTYTETVQGGEGLPWWAIVILTVVGIAAVALVIYIVYVIERRRPY
jgi:hypothetical protein